MIIKIVIMSYNTSAVAQLPHPVLLLLLPHLRHPQPPLPQLVLQVLLGIEPAQHSILHQELLDHVLLLKVADDDGEGQGHREGPAHRSHAAYQLPQPGYWENISIPGR